MNEDIKSKLDFATSLNTYTTSNVEPLTEVDIKEISEKIRPSHAILINNYIQSDGETNIFEMPNFNYEKYYCKKLLLMSQQTYNKIKDLLKKEYVQIRVYGESEGQG